MKRTLIRLGLTALVSSALFGCGGGSDGVNGATVTVPINVSNAQSVATNSATPTSASVSAWRALQPQITVTGVTINSPPVVSFAVTDANGNAVVGLEKNYSTYDPAVSANGSRSSVAFLSNVSFTLAKLVPATATAPSKWVSYLVTNPLTINQVKGTFTSADSCTPDLKWCGTYPTTDKEGKLEGKGDGTYTYTFYRDVKQTASIVASLTDTVATATVGAKLKADLGDLTYDPSATHRLGIVISGAAPGTGSNTPNAATNVPGTNIAIAANQVYDFRPDGGAVTSTRSIVDITSCASCHNGKGLAHGGSRKDPNLCVTCHTDQVKYGMSSEVTRSGLALTGTIQNTTSVLDGRAIGNYPNLIHKYHMGDKLGLTGYNYIPSGGVGQQFEKNEWIQDPRDCTKCHSGVDKTDINQATKTKDGDNWKNNPSRLACGACHDDVSFTPTADEVKSGTTSAGLVAHPGGAATDDSTCASCHAVSGAAVAPIDVAHRAEAPTVNNPTVIDGVSTISYEIKSVTVSANKPAITFRILKDGVPVSTFNTGAGAQPIVGFTGGPTLYVAFAVPQDGITSPADFNASASLKFADLLISKGGLNTISGTVSGTTVTSADPATGYFTVTWTTAIPSTAKMVTGAMIGTFTQVAFPAGSKADAKFTATGLIIKTPLKKLLATGYTARRVVVETTKCESCHEQLGTAVNFHNGARNDATACSICHNTSRASSGWSANASTFIHGIHAGTDPLSVAAVKAVGGPGIAVVGDPGTGAGGAGTAYGSGKRTIPFSWARGTGFNAAANVYPGILKRCDNCHVPNAVNFGASGSALLPNLLWSTSAATTLKTDAATLLQMPRNPADGTLMYGLTVGGAYGTNFGVSGSTVTPAATTTLVESPVTAACFACHDSSQAKLHFTANGGVFYGVRLDPKGVYSTFNSTTVSVEFKNQETCLTCHGMGRDQDAAVVHAK